MTAARLELTWLGKDKFLLVPKDERGKPVWVERDHPAASEVRLADFTGKLGEVPVDALGLPCPRGSCTWHLTPASLAAL